MACCVGLPAVLSAGVCAAVSQVYYHIGNSPTSLDRVEAGAGEWGMFLVIITGDHRCVQGVALLHGSSLYSFVPRFKLVDWTEDGFADLNERWADIHRPPVPKRSNRNATAIALRDFLGGEKLFVQRQPPAPVYTCEPSATPRTVELLGRLAELRSTGSAASRRRMAVSCAPQLLPPTTAGA